MKKQLTVVLIIAILFAGYSACADIIYSQLPRDGGVLFGASFGDQIVDDFTVTQPSEVTGIRWWGSLPNQEDFTIRFFLDDGLGFPSLDPFLELSSVAHTRTTTSLENRSGIDVYQYEAVLETPVNFQGDTKYYVSILNSASWGWLDNSMYGASSSWIRSGDAAVWAPRLEPSADLAFELVPEPATMLLFGLGGVLLRHSTRDARS